MPVNCSCTGHHSIVMMFYSNTRGMTIVRKKYFIQDIIKCTSFNLIPFK